MGQIRTHEQQNTQEGDPPRFWAQSPRNEDTKKKGNKKKRRFGKNGIFPPPIGTPPYPQNRPFLPIFGHFWGHFLNFFPSPPNGTGTPFGVVWGQLGPLLGTFAPPTPTKFFFCSTTGHFQWPVTKCVTCRGVPSGTPIGWVPEGSISPSLFAAPQKWSCGPLHGSKPCGIDRANTFPFQNGTGTLCEVP